MGLLPCSLSSTPIPPKSTSKSKITDFIHTASSPISVNHSCQLKGTSNGDNDQNPLTPISELTVGLKQEQANSTLVRHLSHFQYPGRLLSASNETISLSQIQKLAQGTAIDQDCKKESVVCCTTSSVSHNDTTVKIDQQLGQPLVPEPPNVFTLEDSLEMTEDVCEPNPQTPNQTVFEHKEDLGKQNAKLEDIAVQDTPPHGSPREESPLLFETPSTAGGHHQPLAVKLAKRALAANEIESLKVSPEKNTHSENFDDIDATPPMEQQNEPPMKTAIYPSPVVRTMCKSESTSSVSIRSPAQPKTRKGRKTQIISKSVNTSSPLGHPKVRRANTRLTSKRTISGDQSKQQLLTSFCCEQDKEKNDEGEESVTERVDTDDVDFETVKPLRDKQHSTTKSMQVLC